jgi:uncharacterized membrane protein
MLKKFFYIIFAILISINFSYSSQIDVNTYVYEDYTIFNYVIKLDDNFSQTKFNLKKPTDGKISYLVDKNGPVEYRVSGDKLIFEPKDIDENVFLVKITSEETSKEIFYTDSFRTYMGFNTKINTLNYNLIFKENFGELIDVFPENYTLENEEKYSWTLKDLTKESLFVVNFNKLEEEKDNTLLYIALGLSIFLIIFIVLFTIIYIRYRKEEKRKDRQKVRVKEEKKKEGDIKEVETQSDEIVEPEDTLEDFIEKHLTENEKEVVLLIRDHEGISQYDILNHLPKLTKSNLSKIISKLHSRKILKRIKVGKVNKIHLGEKFEKNEE